MRVWWDRMGLFLVGSWNTCESVQSMSHVILTYGALLRGICLEDIE